MKPRVAINGFGRIGRLCLRANLKNPLLDIVAINDLNGAEQAAHLLKWDSVYGKLDAEVKADGDSIIVDGHKIKVCSDRDPENLPWAEEKIDIVFECTGVFRTTDTASKHLKAGAKKVILSAPGKDEMPTFCFGVNHEEYKPETDHIVSNASCTTNCLSPVAKILDLEFGIKRAMVTTVHSYTSSQNLVDGSNEKLRRARAAALSFFPNTTGAAKALKLVYPAAAENFSGMAIRVPSPTVSIIDLVAEVKTETTPEAINNVFRKYADGPMKGIIDVSDEELVSIDYRGNPFSAVIDSEYTEVVDKNMIKVLAWYDNEWGYANRLNELAAYMSEQGN